MFSSRLRIKAGAPPILVENSLVLGGHNIVKWTQGLCCSSDGSKVYITTGGTDAVTIFQGTLYSSSNGGVSFGIPNATKRNFGYPVCSADGLKVAVYTGNRYDTSAPCFCSINSGVTMTSRGSSRMWAGIACSRDGVILYANGGAAGGVGSFLPSYIAKSVNSGVNWADQTAAGSVCWGGRLKCNGDGSKVLAGYGNNFMKVSYDQAASWAGITTPAGGYSYNSVNMSGNGAVFSGFNGSTFYVSFDSGVTWSITRSAPNNAVINSISLNYDGSRMIMACGSATVPDYVYISKDYGLTWKAISALGNWATEFLGSDDFSRIYALLNGQLYIGTPNWTTF
jgi:hypothetical protein